MINKRLRDQFSSPLLCLKIVYHIENRSFNYYSEGNSVFIMKRSEKPVIMFPKVADLPFQPHLCLDPRNND